MGLAAEDDPDQAFSVDGDVRLYQQQVYPRQPVLSQPGPQIGFLRTQLPGAFQQSPEPFPVRLQQNISALLREA